jgi:hypothetical protein
VPIVDQAEEPGINFGAIGEIKKRIHLLILDEKDRRE